MNVSASPSMKLVMIVLLIGCLTPIFGGCTNVQHQVKLNKEYIPMEDIRIKVAKVVNDTGFDFDIDIEKMLVDALEDQLLEEDLLWLGGDKPAWIMESRIVEYKKGSAFKRWMMPGWGATELSIRCELKDDKGNLVGSALASREVVAGGGYTIGAWKTVFKDVANDVAEDLKDQIESRGYVILPKASPEKTEEKTIAKVDPTQPWTGEWSVSGLSNYSGHWRMIQTGNIVKSTEECAYEIKGKAMSNQFKGRIYSSNSGYSSVINLSMSSDQLSFKGTVDTYWGVRGLIRGEKK